MDNYICSMCYFKGRSIKHLMCHCLLKHKNDGNYIAYCKIQNCMYSTRSWNAFKLHCSRKHPNVSLHSTNNDSLFLSESSHVSSDDSESEDLQGGVHSDGNCFIQNSDVPYKCSFITQLAKYFLSLKCEHKVPQCQLILLLYPVHI